MNNFRIVCDQDGVLTNLMGFWTNKINKLLNTNYTNETWTKYNIFEVLRDKGHTEGEALQAIDILKESVDLYKYSFNEDGAEELIDYLYSIKNICHLTLHTKAVNDVACHGKKLWHEMRELGKVFDTIHIDIEKSSKIVNSDKNNNDCDILIDDNFTYIDKWLRHWNDKTRVGILVKQPWNSDKQIEELISMGHNVIRCSVSEVGNVIAEYIDGNS